MNGTVLVNDDSLKQYLIILITMIAMFFSINCLHRVYFEKIAKKKVYLDKTKTNRAFYVGLWT